jgi:hypothetical protein
MIAVGTLQFLHICENFVISCCAGAGAVAMFVVKTGGLGARFRFRD